ncbi:Lipoprotein signal peptidase [hydrothermal vent metagenome]|uniref:Lipoprotein signal peptidase n=1 Tax=hydrothermal vent metagenome TaxID=652676 RepID=A0A1W1C595_9ZZZZ
MNRNLIIFLLVVIGTIIIDYNIKIWAMESVDGIEQATILKGSCIDLELHYNTGVAFSMLTFLGDNLKWIQLLLILGIIGFVLYEGYLKQYAFAIGLIVGGAIGNLHDRFVYKGVVATTCCTLGELYQIYFK